MHLHVTPRFGGALLLTATLLLNLSAAQTIDSLRVMTYNIWVGGTTHGSPLSRTVGVIQAAQADVIGIQEVGSSGQAIANALGFFHYGINSDISIVSRFPIVETYAQGAKLQISPTQQAYLFDVHLAPYPYQPYDFRDGFIATEAQAISAAQATRGGATAAVLDQMSLALASGAPIFLVGDFNEPSHLDWTAEAAAAGLNFGKKVAWPTSLAVANAGFVDAFRELRPDEINDRGETWTPGNPPPLIDPGEVHDRIDFIYYAGANVAATGALTLGYGPNPNTDIAVNPYPSDHRAVVAEFDIPAVSPLLGDLNGDGFVDFHDWMQLRDWQLKDLSGFTLSQAYSKGDLNRDLKNNHADFVIFKGLYDAYNGVGSFLQALAQVPEPSTVVLAAVALLAALSRQRPADAERRHWFAA